MKVSIAACAMLMLMLVSALAWASVGGDSSPKKAGLILLFARQTGQLVGTAPGRCWNSEILNVQWSEVTLAEGLDSRLFQVAEPTDFYCQDPTNAADGTAPGVDSGG
jgi:hypothetical protein